MTIILKSLNREISLKPEEEILYKLNQEKKLGTDYIGYLGGGQVTEYPMNANQSEEVVYLKDPDLRYTVMDKKGYLYSYDMEAKCLVAFKYKQNGRYDLEVARPGGDLDGYKIFKSIIEREIKPFSSDLVLASVRISFDEYMEILAEKRLSLSKHICIDSVSNEKLAPTYAELKKHSEDLFSTMNEVSRWFSYAHYGTVTRDLEVAGLDILVRN